MSTPTRAAGLLVSAITMTAVLAACSSSGSDAGSASDADTSSSYGSGSGGSSSGADGSAEAPGGASREFGGAEDTASAPAAGGPTTQPMERALISSGTVSMSSTDVGETRQEVQRIVDAQGGDITEESSETDEEGATSYARLVIRVPSTKFGATMSALDQVEGVLTSNRGSDDVTTEVIDNDVRVRAQEASLERVEMLLAEARSLKNLIWIESQLTTRQAELDSLKSQQSWLSDQTSLSTITVDISQRKGKVVEEEDDEPAGFLDGLRGGMKALGGTFAAIGLIVGALLPFAVVALVLGLPAWLVVRRRRGERVPAGTSPS